VTIEDINWIVKRAAKRGYKTPNAFMSSKPKSGINHKEFGVTSEGVNTYLDVALRKVLSIDPKSEPFSIKITGGPDGDVAGNEIKILLREYGDNAVIVGIGKQHTSFDLPLNSVHVSIFISLIISLIFISLIISPAADGSGAAEDPDGLDHDEVSILFMKNTSSICCPSA